MTTPSTRSRARRLAAALLTALPAWPALADGVRLPAQVPPAYRSECGACHVAYPPGLLPAASWLRLMGSLERHYGTDASLDAATVQQLSTWLQAHAGIAKRISPEPPPQDRITRSAWFERKHRPLDDTVWRLPSVKSPANCAACHGGAEQGRFDEHDLRMPAGLPARYRHAFLDD